MSRTAKITIGVIVGLVLLCVCVSLGSVFIFVRSAGDIIEESVSMAENPAEIAPIAQSIVQYDLPAGYTERMGMNLLGFKIVGFGPTENNNQMIMLMEMPKFSGMSQAEMEQQLRQSIQQQTGRRTTQFKVVDEIDKTIRDQSVTFTISEGIDEDGNTMRQMSGVFEGENGVVLLMAMGNAKTWNQGPVDSFIDSLR